MSNLVRLNCTVPELYDPEDFEKLVNQRQNELKRKRARRRAERRMRRLELTAGVLSAGLLAVAVAATLWLV